MNNNYFDCSKVVLTPAEQVAFAKFENADKAILTRDEYHLLEAKELVPHRSDEGFHTLPENMEMELTTIGKTLKQYQKQRRSEDKKQNHRYWINTGIAIASALISLCALVSSCNASHKVDSLQNLQDTTYVEESAEGLQGQH